MDQTVCHALLEAKKRKTTMEAARFVNNGKWVSVNWPEYYANVENVAGGLRNMGVERGSRVAIMANTRFEWAIMDMAIMGIGAYTIPIYESSTPEDVQYVIENSEATVLAVENESVYNKFAQIKDQTPNLRKTIVFDAFQSSDPNIISYEELLKNGKAFWNSNDESFEEHCKKAQIDDVATIVYTSGTTGSPKGVVLTHRQIMSETNDVFSQVNLGPEDRSLTFLPFAHILGRVEHIGGVIRGYCTAYAESIDRIKGNLLDVRPTFLVAVPRIFEKIYSGVVAQAEISPMKSKVFNWAMSVGRQVSHARIHGRSLPPSVLFKYQAAKKLVFDKLSEKMGGRLRFAVSGGAPLSRDIAEFFHAANLLLLEGYGLTETTAAVTLNTPYAYKFGTVGKPIGDVEIKIADDGEICVKSDKVMKEYYKNPEATAEVLEDGWFKTGDIGEFTPDGFLKITDRKKDLIKTAGGKYVAPQKLENLLKLSKYISNVLIHGDKKKYIVALICVDFDALEEFASSEKIDAKSRKDLLKSEPVQQLMRDEVAEVNAKLASFETIKNFSLLDKDFTVEDGELTPSLKVKRKFCDEKYKETIEKLYRS